MTEDQQSKNESMIREMMETFGVDRLQAAFIVAQHLGETDGDVHETSALSKQERYALGLGISLAEAIRRDRGAGSPFRLIGSHSSAPRLVHRACSSVQ